MRSVVRDPRSRMPVVLAITIAAACSKTETANTDTAAAKAADTAAAAPAMYASAGVTDSMKTPESVRYDADLDAYFVSNINGNPSQKDGNGFIARVDAANTSTVTMLAQGGKGGVTLNAPKGMAIVGDTLWVADIDAMRAFNKRTGAPVATVDLRSMKATFLNDVVAGPDGSIYITDTGVRFDAKGGMTHPGQDQIFKIVGRKATVAIKSDSALKAPNGIAWDGANSRFILGPFNDKAVSAWKDGDSRSPPWARGRASTTAWRFSATAAFSSRAGPTRRSRSSRTAPSARSLATSRAPRISAWTRSATWWRCRDSKPGASSTSPSCPDAVPAVTNAALKRHTVGAPRRGAPTTRGMARTRRRSSRRRYRVKHDNPNGRRSTFPIEAWGS